MDEPQLENELQIIRQTFLVLWEQYNFHVRYLANPTERGLILRISNGLLSILIETEFNSPSLGKFLFGTKHAWFSLIGGSYIKTYGWYSLEDLAPLLGNVPTVLTDGQEKDFDILSHYLRSHMDELLDLFKDPKDLEKRLQSAEKH